MISEVCLAEHWIPEELGLWSYGQKNDSYGELNVDLKIAMYGECINKKVMDMFCYFEQVKANSTLLCEQ